MAKDSPGYEILENASGEGGTRTLTGELIAGFGVEEEFANPVALLLGEHPFEHRALSELEEAAGDHVVLLAPEADIQATDEYGAALRMWRAAFPGWRPELGTFGNTASLARQRWEYVQHYIHPVSCAYFFTRGAPRTPVYHQQVQHERRDLVERIARSVQACPTTRAMPRWVVPLWPTSELRADPKSHVAC
jgi:hypothetical protein